jgi:pilus assembly protein CpaC
LRPYLILTAWLAPLLGTLPALAQGVTIPVPQSSTATATATPRPLSLEAGRGQVIALPAPAANIFVADPTVAQVRPASPATIFVFGTGVGETTVAALSAQGQPIAQFTVTVRPSAYGAGQAASAISQAIPGTDIQVQTSSDGLALTGEVQTPEEAEQAEEIAQHYALPNQRVEDRLQVTGGTQVLLRVRIAEMSRSITRQLGVDWQALGTIVGSHLTNPITGLVNGLSTAQFAASYINPGVNVTAIIDALAEDNLAKVLAEPNLTTLSGKTASFLAGGEYPIPISGSLGTTTVEYKDYGISLTFLPTVLSDSRISLQVKPEVSQLTSAGAVTVSSGSSTLTIPALTIRRADTTVELGSGQTFAIAGLLQDTTTQSATGIPILGDMPVVGGLFRSTTLEHDQTELVFLVTPYIVRPVDNPSTLALPGARFDRPPNDFERLFLQIQTTRDEAPVNDPPTPTEAGFLVQ